MPTVIADDGARLHFTSIGNGPRTVFFLHCLGGNTATWTRLWKAMNLAGLRCVALDFRGTGESERDPCELTNDRLARDVLFVADQLNATSFVVVGHSMGAKLGLFLTIVAPERVRALVLMGCPSPGIVPIERRVLEEYLAQPNRRAYTETFFRPWYKVWPRPEIDAFLDSFANMPEWALLASCEVSIWTDFSQRISGIDCPTLNVIGEHDPMYGPAYQREAVLPHVPHAEIITIDCGHGMMLERPDEVAAPLDSFLARLS